MKNVKFSITSMMLILFALYISVGLQAQTRQVEDFSKIAVSTGVGVELLHTTGQTEVEIDMIKGDAEDLVTEVRNNTLHIKFKRKFLNWGGNNSRAKVKVYYRDLNGIDLSSGSSLAASHTIEANDFDVDVSSGSSLSIMLQADLVSVDLSSGSSIKMSGEVSDLVLDTSSGSTFQGSDLAADNVRVDSSSGSSVKVWAKKSITAEANSGSTISYKGNPDNKNIEVSKYSGGSVRAINK